MIAIPPRAMEALRLSAHGQKEAATRMGVSVHTVKRHLERAYNCLGVDSLMDAYRMLGWLVIPGEDAEATRMEAA